MHRPMSVRRSPRNHPGSFPRHQPDCRRPGPRYSSVTQEESDGSASSSAFRTSSQIDREAFLQQMHPRLTTDEYPAPPPSLIEVLAQNNDSDDSDDSDEETNNPRMSADAQDIGNIVGSKRRRCSSDEVNYAILKALKAFTANEQSLEEARVDLKRQEILHALALENAKAELNRHRLESMDQMARCVRELERDASSNSRVVTMLTTYINKLLHDIGTSL